MTPIPTFETQRLILRGVTLDDEPCYTKYFINYDVISELASSIPWPYPEGGVNDYILNHILPYQGLDKWVWGLFLKTNPNELIGAIELCRKPSPANRGFWLGKPFWGRGYMTEAIVPTNDYAFNHLNFDKLIFTNASGNIRSRRIKEKTGAKLLDVQPQDNMKKDYTAKEVWELTKENWKALAKD